MSLVAFLSNPIPFLCFFYSFAGPFDVLSEAETRESLLYSYKNSINGFAALLSDEEATKLSGKEKISAILLLWRLILWIGI